MTCTFGGFTPSLVALPPALSLPPHLQWDWQTMLQEKQLRTSFKSLKAVRISPSLFYYSSSVVCPLLSHSLPGSLYSHLWVQEEETCLLPVLQLCCREWLCRELDSARDSGCSGWVCLLLGHSLCCHCLWMSPACYAADPCSPSWSGAGAALGPLWSPHQPWIVSVASASPLPQRHK